MPTQLTLKTVNNMLKWMGLPERLVKGKGYYYFCEGEAPTWHSTTVCVNRLNALSFEQWMREYETLSGKTLLEAAPIEDHYQLSLRLQASAPGAQVEFAGMTFCRTDNAVDIDGDLFPLDGLYTDLNTLFHYEALDCAGDDDQ